MNHGYDMKKEFLFRELSIEGVYLISPFKFDDARGYNLKFFSEEIMKEHGIDFIPKEIMNIYSAKGTLRGIHYQSIKEQSKIIVCLRGSIACGIVDLREESHKYCRTLTVLLANEDVLFVPKGCALGTLAKEDSLMCYMSDEKEYKEYARGIRWDDPELGINWGIADKEKIKISGRDLGFESLKDFLSHGIN